MGPARFAVPEVLFNHHLLESFGGEVAAEVTAAAAAMNGPSGAVEAVQGLQGVVTASINK